MRTDIILPTAILVFATLALAVFAPPPQPAGVAHAQEVTLPAIWGNLGARLVELGIIDPQKMRELYGTSWNEEYERLLTGESGALVMSQENSGYLLNLLWALGLANKNPILEDETEMMNPAYGSPSRFASTGGWTLAAGDAMDHYDIHEFIILTQEQQRLVDKISRKVFRPCCGNSAHFPDCNHGMAMLALLELMTSQGVQERELYSTANIVNSFWFPEEHQSSCSA
ncbi:hypothetical protein A2852_02735 [Candidatus Adlerbacteria bacterium RIFCSPHIGHO2_01_FULL_54_23]|uniref:Uncharacterized protein n=3 Tax=Candidatus Adleribacteriota TaxID=1752736 RepID=A0A1F4XZK3_9BACT|nr:MAG: hypothetical protein UY83_C0006G0019 [Candidatus Adlerbacteria bacterium GW2011_GWA1_54_10]KKW37683.1 MAG: hypothetical protein UY86_C0004G0012 [Candidatus Adlerbacteria bacterium GW2011_GWB1_54_7]OGC79509.1 MAG: hypothetical protein A2852_02735 [Candidatus Adlerbacteria bacterium RIFCSPHIGHO2_01_FULL_54_23]OGC87157.1 MAG: hypothetical protein A3B33_01095 [Candidatus Adlerbacteria bacterium RIFCSPLOWO2_01_FULL_54_16]